MSTITVVMATFNGEAWLDTQLESIARQTRLPDRLVISDDGSTDDTLKIARSFSTRAPFEVILVDGPQGGIAENFWSAAQVAKTEFIAWSDQDDFWYPEKLRTCEWQLKRFDAPFATHSAMVTDAELRPSGRQFPRYKRTRVLNPLEGDPWKVASGFTTVVRSDLLSSLRWDQRPLSHQSPRPVSHDQALSLIAFASCRRVEIHDELASYRQHESNAAGAPTMNGIEKIRFAMNSDAHQYARLADIAAGYATFIDKCDPNNTRAIEYFYALERQCLRRTNLHQAPSPMTSMRYLATSMRHRDFRPRSRGGFGLLALSRDVIGVGFGTAKRS